MSDNAVPEIIGAVAACWKAAGPRVALTAGVGLALGLVWPKLPPRARTVGAVVLGLAALAWGLTRVSALTWLADDAFISFRYAEHFAAGDGFVFNPGEKVEGYTNFLLVLALGLARLLGAGIPHVALVVDVASFVALVVLAEALVRCVRPAEPVTFPWGALAVAAARPFHLFATSGLETEVALALAAGGVLAWRKERPVAASVLLGLAALTRPDHLLIAGATWLVALLTTHGPGRWRFLVRLVAPALVLFITWWAWRWWYYADFFPNTFHAKSGGSAYWAQGVIFLVHTLFASGVVFALPLLVVAPLVALREVSATPLLALAFAVAATHGLYVTRVGGDFMEYRFLLPSLYFVLVAWGATLRVADGLPWRALRWVAVAAAAVGFAVIAQDTRPIGPMEKRWNLAAEESFWPVERVFPLTITHEGAKEGLHLRAAFEGTGVAPRMALGAIGASGYFSGLPITDSLGLTSRTIARKPVERRGRPGHEKSASPDEMADEGAVFSNAPVWPGTIDTLRVVINGRAFWLIRHDAALEKLARARGWTYPDLDALMDAAVLSAQGPAALAKDRAFYEKLLHGTPGAAQRLGRFEPAAVQARLRALSAPPAEAVAQRLRQAEAFGLEDVARALSKRVAQRMDFEDEARPAMMSDALWPPTAGTAASQLPVQGFHGQRLLNTYARGDATTGRLELPLAPGGWVDFLVGGGDACATKYVAVVDGAREVGRWCGTQSEQLRSVQVNLAGLAVPKLVLVDDDTGAWGHLLLDDVVVVSAAR
ncbi:MAG: hypothetical protein AB1938_11450 [Myxococcota bacterium]